ncbi:MAG: class II aldolase/adducin family protein [Candidatus Omnitrophica bacterium]|nr:class II aldolase/adducin family protein [Candidatus Omnitrophota bacterium]
MYNINELKAQLIQAGKLLWDKDLVGGLNGNISFRVDARSILITARGGCLGCLDDSRIVHLGLDGAVLAGGEPSSEKLLHLEIYRRMPDVAVILHTHTTFTNAFFLKNDVFKSETFEGAYVLGEVVAVDQSSINVADVGPVVDKLVLNPIAALRRHGVVSVGVKWFDAFVRIQTLEEQVKMAAVARLFAKG